MALTDAEKLQRQKQVQKRYYEKNKDKIIQRQDNNFKHLAVRTTVYNKIKDISSSMGIGIGKFIENLINKY